jgi:hypothetical protein
VLAIELQSVAAINYYRCARKLSNQSCDIRNQLAKYKNQTELLFDLIFKTRKAKSLNILRNHI